MHDSGDKTDLTTIRTEAASLITVASSRLLSMSVSSTSETRKLCYRKNDRAYRALYKWIE